MLSWLFFNSGVGGGFGTPPDKLHKAHDLGGCNDKGDALSLGAIAQCGLRQFNRPAQKDQKGRYTGPSLPGLRPVT